MLNFIVFNKKIKVWKLKWNTSGLLQYISKAQNILPDKKSIFKWFEPLLSLSTSFFPHIIADRIKNNLQVVLFMLDLYVTLAKKRLMVAFKTISGSK